MRTSNRLFRRHLSMTRSLQGVDSTERGHSQRKDIENFCFCHWFLAFLNFLNHFLKIKNKCRRLQKRKRTGTGNMGFFTSPYSPYIWVQKSDLILPKVKFSKAANLVISNRLYRLCKKKLGIFCMPKTHGLKWCWNWVHKMWSDSSRSYILSVTQSKGVLYILLALYYLSLKVDSISSTLVPK